MERVSAADALKLEIQEMLSRAPCKRKSETSAMFTARVEAGFASASAYKRKIREDEEVRWPVARGTRLATRDTRRATRDARRATRDTRHATCGMWHTTRGTRHGTRDTRHATRGTRHGLGQLADLSALQRPFAANRAAVLPTG
jgi:hypothetical protein